MDYLIFEGYTLEIVFLSDRVKRVKGKKQNYQKHKVLVGRVSILLVHWKILHVH